MRLSAVSGARGMAGRDDDLGAIAQRAGQGCADAQSLLYHRLKNWLLAVIRTVPGLRADCVEEALHEVMIHVYAKLPRYKPHRPLLPWLARVVRNKVLDLAAVERRQSGVPLDGQFEPSRDDADYLESVEERLGLWACIYFDSPLTREERIIVVYYEKALGSHDRVSLASAMGIRPGAFDRFWASARRKLCECMTEKSV
jgi:DNA-directed RNA polymerase specialized sigma24 family protein